MPSASSIVWPAAGIALMLGLHVTVALWRSVGHDEFFVYSQIHQLARGELTLPLQTFQTRLLEWILLLDVGNIDQIVAARGLMFVCVMITAGAIVSLAERFTERKVALVCALSWLSMGFVMQHGTSLRTDPMAAALLMTSLVLMLRSRLGFGALLLTATLAALSGLITMKTVLYAPAFAGIAWLRWHDAGRTREAGLRLIGLAAMVPVLYALFYLAHSSLLPSGADVEAVAEQSAGLMFQPFVMRHWQYMLKGALVAPFLTVIIITMFIMLCRKSKLGAAEKLALAGLLLPLSAFVFYANAFPYFFVFILPPVCVACAVSIEAATRRYSVAILSLVLTLNGAAIWWMDDRNLQNEQRRIVDAADMIFAQPVLYFDGPAQLGQYRRENGQLDAWSFEGYRYGDYSVSMEAATDRETIPLAMANSEEMSDVLEKARCNRLLRPGDVTMLKDTYIRFWGPYFVAGEELQAGETRLAKIRVPGPYTVRDAPLVINGTVHQPGEIVELDRGTIRVAASADAARLIWGQRLKEPAMPAPDGVHWTRL
jgi:hypothetical protein